MDPISAIIATANFVFTSQTLVANIIRFVGSTLISAALGASKQPLLSDLKVQTSQYGANIPRLYGTAVRVAGNVIDKTDLIPVRHKKGQILGIGGVKYFTYDAHVAVLICEGTMKVGGLRRVFADGQVIFDRDADGATPGTVIASGGTLWSKANKTQSKVLNVTFYPGDAVQTVDGLLQSIHPGETLSAYRHSCYVVLERIQCSDFGNRVPNLEFEVEPEITVLGDIVTDIASYSGADVYATGLDQTVRGYVVAQDGSAWDAIQPLAGTFSFDVVSVGNRFDAVKRGRYMRTLIPSTKWAARPVGEGAKPTKEVSVEDPNQYPDEVSFTYFDETRDYQPNTQRAFRNSGFSKNKINTTVAIVLTPDEARDVAQIALAETLAKARTIKIALSDEFRWLQDADVVGLEVAGEYQPFRLGTMTRSPNGAIECDAYLEDPFIYVGGLTGSGGTFPSNPVLLPGPTIMQPIDGPIILDADDDTGFYAVFGGTGNGWRGATVERAPGIGSPLTYETLGDIGLGGTIADCATTLAAGPTDVWDRVNTLTVTVLTGDAPVTASETDVVGVNANLAWVGGSDGEDGELINFATVAAGSPAGTYVLSNLLRGRYGTESAVGLHGAAERFVLLTDRDTRYRMQVPAALWNAPQTYRVTSLPDDDVTTQVVTDTGRGKRPLSPVHLLGTRNGTNDDVVISWQRRTRLDAPALGGGAVPLGEDVESYQVDVYTHGSSPPVAARTLTSATPAVTYTAAMLAADGYSAGNLIACTVYQMSGTFGRGEGATGRL